MHTPYWLRLSICFLPILNPHSLTHHTTPHTIPLHFSNPCVNLMYISVTFLPDSRTSTSLPPSLLPCYYLHLHNTHLLYIFCFPLPPPRTRIYPVFYSKLYLCLRFICWKESIFVLSSCKLAVRCLPTTISLSLPPSLFFSLCLSLSYSLSLLIFLKFYLIFEIPLLLLLLSHCNTLDALPYQRFSASFTFPQPSFYNFWKGLWTHARTQPLSMSMSFKSYVSIQTNPIQFIPSIDSRSFFHDFY